MDDEVKLNKEQIKGQIKGLNTARIRIWGIGYDHDETALMMRRFLCEQIEKLQDMLDIDGENEEGAMTSTPLPEQGGFNERLDEILTAKFSTRPDGGAWCMKHLYKLEAGLCRSCEAADAIRTLVLEEIIGQDVELRDPDGHQPNAYMYLKKGKNELRAEQRKKLEDSDE